jgi:thymidylate synthase
MKQYLDLVQHVMKTVVKKGDRQVLEQKRIRYQMRFNLQMVFHGYY